MRLTIIFKDEFEEYMKKQFGHFTNPKQVYGVKSVHMEGGYLYSTDLERYGDVRVVSVEEITPWKQEVIERG